MSPITPLGPDIVIYPVMEGRAFEVVMTVGAEPTRAIFPAENLQQLIRGNVGQTESGNISIRFRLNNDDYCIRSFTANEDRYVPSEQLEAFVEKHSLAQA
jgi:hypothetical protein